MHITYSQHERYHVNEFGSHLCTFQLCDEGNGCLESLHLNLRRYEVCVCVCVCVCADVRVFVCCHFLNTIANIAKVYIIVCYIQHS